KRQRPRRTQAPNRGARCDRKVPARTPTPNARTFQPNLFIRKKTVLQIRSVAIVGHTEGSSKIDGFERCSHFGGIVTDDFVFRRNPELPVDVAPTLHFS